MSCKTRVDRWCRARRWSSQVYDETRTSSSRGGLRAVAVRWRFFPRVEEPRSETDVGVAKRQKSQRKKSKSRAEAFHQPRCWCETKGKAVERRASCKITADRHRGGGGGELEGSRHTTLYEAPAGSKPLQHEACAHRIGEDPRCICCQNKIEYENPLSLGSRRSGGGEVISHSVGDLDSIPLPGCPRRAG